MKQNQLKTRRSGFTLIEVVLTISLASVLMVVVGISLASVQSAFIEGTLTASQDDSIRRGMDRIVAEVRFAQLGTLVLSPSVDATSLTYNNIEGWGGTVPVFGASKTISLSSGALVVDGNVVARDITSLTFNLNGPVLSITLEGQKQFSDRGTSRTLTRQLSTQVKL